MVTVSADNVPAAILKELVASIDAATWLIGGLAVFDYTSEIESVQTFKDKRLSKGLACGIVLNGVEDFVYDDLRIGHVADYTLLICTQPDFKDLETWVWLDVGTDMSAVALETSVRNNTGSADNWIGLIKQTSYGGNTDQILVALSTGTIDDITLSEGIVWFPGPVTSTLDAKDLKTLRKTESQRLVAAIKNLINADVPSDAKAFYAPEEEEITPRLLWGEPETDSESQVPWQFTELNLRVAFVTTNETSH